MLPFLEALPPPLHAAFMHAALPEGAGTEKDMHLSDVFLTADDDEESYENDVEEKNLYGPVGGWGGPFSWNGDLDIIMQHAEAMSNRTHISRTGCPRDCVDSTHGRCVEGVCLCRPNFNGTDCSNPVPYPYALSLPKTFKTVSETVGNEEARQIIEYGMKRHPSLHICIVTWEVEGPIDVSGIGTALTTLAHTLSRAGHKVTILYTKNTFSYKGDIEEHIEAYKAKNITLALLDTEEEDWDDFQATSYQILDFFR